MKKGGSMQIIGDEIKYKKTENEYGKYEELEFWSKGMLIGFVDCDDIKYILKGDYQSGIKRVYEEGKFYNIEEEVINVES